ncbi:HEPN domain-containing protein [Paraflavisolibacter sp. H34]|uniref:HEPN domain-containing protein n=1 Tax=Huijunlia imazamoxiresistens TaxID=3127457 RepID=UPI003019FE43
MNDTHAEMAGIRKKKALDTMKEARALATAKSWNQVPDRLYYAAFYMVGALLAQNGFFARTHTGHKSLFFKEFVRTSRITAQSGDFFQRLFDGLTEGNYKEMAAPEEGEMRRLIKETESFLNEIKIILVSK